jgi:hypothetical protein
MWLRLLSRGPRFKRSVVTVFEQGILVLEMLVNSSLVKVGLGFRGARQQICSYGL